MPFIISEDKNFKVLCICMSMYIFTHVCMCAERREEEKRNLVSCFTALCGIHSLPCLSCT